MLTLLETLFDIIRLKKGPDAIPYSWFVCLISLALWLTSGLVVTLLVEQISDVDFLVATFTGVVALACYASIVVLANRTPRLLQTITAILGCSAVINFLYVAGSVFLTPFFSKMMTSLVMTLLSLWAIPVEGHIIARAIDRHWYIGIMVAISVFLFQLYVYSLLVPPAPEAATATAQFSS